MTTKRALVLVAVVLCGTGVATGQTEWVEHPDNPNITDPPFSQKETINHKRNSYVMVVGDDINKAISINRDYGEAYFILGNIALKSGDYDAAIMSYSKAKAG